jgi:hypothetical protein
LWLVLCRIPGIADTWDVRVLLSSLIIAAYTWAAAYEFWRGRSEPLVSRWPAIFMLFAHGALYLLRTPFGAMLPWSPTGNQVFESVWLTVLSFEALLFTISIAFILLAMAKERTEHRHKTAALVDPLTGISNRRAFLQDGEALLRRQAAIRARPRSCCSTSTISNRSMTASATPSAIACCSCSRRSRATACAAWICSAGSAARNSPQL